MGQWISRSWIVDEKGVFLQPRYGSATLLPDLRIAMPVDDSDDRDVARQDDEVDHIRKAMNERHANIIEHDRKLLWLVFDRQIGTTDLIGERAAESRPMRVVSLKG